MSGTTLRLFDPDDPATVADPYPAYARLRRVAPVHHLPEHDLWLVTRHADVLTVLGDPQRYSSEQGMGARPRLHGARSLDYRIGAPGVRVLIATDPPVHTAFRATVAPAFRRPPVEALAPHVRRVAEGLVGELIARQEERGADMYRDLAEPLPALVLAELFGVPADMHDAFRAWATTVTDDLRAADGRGAGDGPGGGLPRLGRGYEMFRYFWREIARRKHHPSDDLLGRVAQVDRAGLSDYEAMAFCAFLLVAGVETTTNLLTNLTHALVRFPDVQRALWDDPDLAGDVVEEALRFDTSVQALWRATTEPVHLAGVRLPAGARLLVVFGSANRDESVFTDPDSFVPGREHDGHLAFGFGHHRCLGARLAQSELRAALGVLLRTTGGIEPAGAFVRTDSLILRGFSSQPVRLLPATTGRGGRG